MNDTKPVLGVIEGFFGRDWGWDARIANFPILAREGVDLYVYAPKSDRFLRQDWRKLYAPDQLARLLEAREAARRAQVQFGIGLTPFGIDPQAWRGEAAALRAKLDQLRTLDLDWICVLFDDTYGGMSGLADLHVRATDLVTEAAVAPRCAMCPAYYSDDPILDEVFGARPEGYLEDLGRALPEEVRIFWTGKQVVSEMYAASDLAEITERLARKPLIWDNGAVNDSRLLSPYLPLAPKIDRAAPLADGVSGLMINPINQPALARLTIGSVARQWAGQGSGFDALLEAYASPELADRLREDLHLFATVGHDNLNAAQRAALLARYTPLAAEPMGREILDWVQGGYVFDAACLT